jgi:hypothetical protein
MTSRTSAHENFRGPRFHAGCGKVTERYVDGECRPCSIARKALRRSGDGGTRTIRVGNDMEILITVRRRP